MGKPSRSQICSSFLMSKLSLLCVAVLVPSLVFTCFLGFGVFSVILTVPILILSTTFLVTFSKKEKQIFAVENSVKEENPICDPISNLHENEPEERLQPEQENVASNAAAVQQSEVGLIDEPADFLSDNESSGDSVSNENFELDWMRCNNLDQNGETSSDSVSEDDEDSLIEIAIPGSDSTSSLSDEEPKQKVMQSNNLPDFLPESFIKQQDLLELFTDINEVNEEENLIEIDISMGSIKCSRLEIEA